MNEKEFVLSLRAAHNFFDEIGVAQPLVGPISLPVHAQFNQLALDTEIPYADVFSCGLKLGHYNFRLTDFSYLHFSYSNEDDVRYAFYPSPFTKESMGTLAMLERRLGAASAEDVELLLNFAASAEVNSNRPVVRYEYNKKQYRHGLHPVSHLHIGTFGDDRWPIFPRLTPLAFAMLIAKLYYRPYWEAVTVGEGQDRTNEFDDALAQERKKCAGTPDDYFEFEAKAFYFL